MANIQISNDQRVFQVDNECYILYLGEHPDDDRPFVRLGTSPWLYQKIQDNLSTVLVPENYTGNPLQEVDLAKTYQGRYLGNPRVVNILRDFFDSCSLPEKQVTDYNEAEKGEGRDLAYFYSNGNVTLSFQKNKIFDLFQLEKKDRHFTQRCREQKQVFLKKPVRYDRDDFKDRGFFLTEDEFYLFEKGALFGLKMTRDYFENLCASGVDADMIQGALVKLSVDSMGEDRGETFIHLLKRASSIRRGIQVFTFDQEVNNRISLLFPDEESLPSVLKLNHIEKGKSFQWKSYKLDLEETRYRFSLDGQHYFWARGGKEILLGEEAKPVPFPLLKGIPYQLRKQDLSHEEVLEKYIKKLSYHLSVSEKSGDKKRSYQQSASLLEAFLSSFKAGKVQLSQVSEKIYQDFKKDMKRLTIEEYSYYFYSNCRVFLIMLMQEGTPAWNKKIQPIVQVLEQMLLSCKVPDPVIFPAQGYLWKEFFFYLPVHRQKRMEERMKTLQQTGEIHQLSEVDTSFYKEERIRLEALLQGLEGGTVIIQNPAEKEKSPEKKTTEDNKNQDKESQTSAEKISGSIQTASKKNSGESSGKKRKFWWLLLLLLLLLIPSFLFIPGSPLNVLSSESALSQWIDGQGNFSDQDGETDGRDGSDTDNSDGSVSGTGESSEEKSDAEEGSSTAGGSDSTSAGGNSSTEESAGSPSAAEDEPSAELNGSEDSMVVKPFVIDQDFLESFQVDGVFITMADIHLYANSIAVQNGYRDLGFYEVDGADPTFIYPGSTLKIPGEGMYRVEADDNIWFIAAAFLEKQLKESLILFRSWKEEWPSASGSRKDELIKSMEKAIEQSNCENFRTLLANWLEDNR